jgi:tetratricopeptide (TPR) repeat protein
LPFLKIDGHLMAKKSIQKSNTIKVTAPIQNKVVATKSVVTSSVPWWPPLLAMVVTFLCFTSSLDNQFVNWDDDRNFYENKLVQHIDKNNFWENSKEIFSSGVIGNYNPLTIWTFAIEKVTFGFDQPFYWHLDNLLLHLICVFLAYRIAILLGVGWQGSLLIALLFGIHPMRVESVAWVTERKDVLFGAFYLAALLQYVKYKLDHLNIRWIWMTLFFVLSLFSKIQAVSLPLSMILIDYYMDKEWTMKSVINKIPFFILSLIFGIVGVIMLRDFGSLSSASDTTQFSFFQRLFVGAFSFIIYLVKLVVPFRMSPLYPYPNYFPWYFYPSMLILPIVLYVLYQSYKNEWKAIFFGLSFFIVNIIFLLQILGAGQGYLADRFTYIAYFGLFFIAGYYFDRYLNRKESNSNVGLFVIGVFVMVFGFMTFQQNKIWQDSGTLWSHVLKYYQNTTLPYGNRANFYRDKKMYKEAIADYNVTIGMKGDQPQAYNSRARLYFDLAKGRDSLMLALNDYNKAIQYDPKDGEFRVNRGATYARLGDIQKAIEDLTEGIKLKPDHAVGYLNRSIMYHNLNRVDLALQDIESYLKLVPYNGDLWYEKARALRLLGRTEESIPAYTEAMKYESGNKALFYYERAKTYFELHKINEAKADLQQAISMGFNGIDPAFRMQLGM